MRKDFSRQGPFYLAKNTNGKIGAARWVGDTGTVNVTVAETKEERKENYTGLRGTSVVLSQGTTVTVELNVRYADAENLALALHGKLSTKAAGTVTGEVFPTGAVGEYFVLDHGAATNLVLTDSTPVTPVTLTEGTHYRVNSAKGGLIELLSITGITQPIKAAYSYGGSRNLSILTKRPDPMYLFMDSINTVDQTRERIHFYKVQFDPIANMGLINENLGELTLTGTCYVDANNQLDDELGPYGRIEQIDEVV